MNENYTSLDACVLTPIWKDVLDENELQNIEYSLKVTENLIHKFICPQSLNVDFYQLRFPDSGYIQFDDVYFSDINGYNLLLQSNFFYERFLHFKFIIILQTDAIIMKPLDSLLATEFDYIAAPWENGLVLPLFLFNSKIFTFVLKAIGLRKKCYIGNGGLSIRRISAFLDLCKMHNPIQWLNEDMHFGLLAARGFIKVPDFETAKEFFFEKTDKELDKLPEVYGYHAIQRYYPDKYSLIFKK